MAVAQVLGPGEWLGSELRDGDVWRVRLDEGHRREIVAAVHAAEAAHERADDVGAFPLPTLGPVLRRVREDVLDGRGFALVQGVPTGELTERQYKSAALGLAGHLGGIVPQGPGRAPLMHVRDTGADLAQPRTKSYEHSGRLGYHSDPTDLVALLCLRPARSGGLSSIVSSVAVHNELVRTRPDLAELLYQPWWHDRRTGDGPDSFYTKPLCTPRPGGRLSISYGPDYLRSARRGAHVPPFTAAEQELMDLLDRLTADPRFALTMDLREGDLQVLNNHVVLHSRTAYEDHPEPERRRHLLRLWLTADPPR